jgi:hypothetical protein
MNLNTNLIQLHSHGETGTEIIFSGISYDLSGRKSCNLGHLLYLDSVYLFETWCGHFLTNNSFSLTNKHVD